MEELKKCPFCGGEAIITSDFKAKGTIIICCKNQKCKVNPYVAKWTLEKAVDAWNEREIMVTAKEDMQEIILLLKMLLRATERGRVVKNLILSDDQKEIVVDWADCGPSTIYLEGHDGMDVINYVTASL